ncbi:aldose 1-epimerase [Psychromonas ingrahamii 37]|uniref:Aldose 1-epimerase n=1 Tax=Psychromonas ingrahamii (strain DSM 17664 / CCUG 51855 / 37) TaxID=357804 RepID=A1SWB7_PSYIN|nr:galactose-1-epimerase [Psychromonas ingrahamii]ABM03782.1 aldose 1-epimerase [Psychromonas ingrahamii 37]
MTLSRAEQLQKSMSIDPAFDGQPAKIFVLKNRLGMCITLMDIGATWLSCEIPVGDQMRDVILGVTTMNDHLRQKAYLGATIGRFANRLSGGQFKIAGQHYQVDKNQGNNTLHGGVTGFDKCRWHAQQLNNQCVTFTLLSKDGDQGFPGNLDVKVTYHLSDDNELSIDYWAVTDKACPVSLTNHAYFNLMGESGQCCLQHQLFIAAEHYLPVNNTGIPIGHIKPVAGSRFDFSALKEISQDFLSCQDQKIVGGYDHSFLINKAHQDGSKVAAKCVSPDKKVTLEIKTTQPALQLYTGNYLGGTPNRSGGTYKNRSALALETQFLPDAPNHPEWDQPSSILLPGEVYAHQTSYRFTVAD